MGNDVDMWEIAEICGKWLEYLTNSLNVAELTERFWKMDKTVVTWLRYMGRGLNI